MPDDEIPDRVVITALEFAVGIAAAGAKLRPPLAFPVELRPFLKFQKLPAKALRDVRAAVEADVAFRERISGVAVADLLDEAGMLWLTRPDGWVERLGELAAAGGDDRGDLAAELRRAERRREAAEAATRRAAAEVAALRAELVRRGPRRERRTSGRGTSLGGPSGGCDGTSGPAARRTGGDGRSRRARRTHA